MGPGERDRDRDGGEPQAGGQGPRRLRSHRAAFLGMAALSLVTLVLGAGRELLIARDLRASGDADLFFRGLVVLGAARMVGLSLFRSRWLPAPGDLPGSALLRATLPLGGLLLAIALAALLGIVGPAAWGEGAVWIYGVGVALALLGAALRALAERAGHERRGFILEWGLPLGAIIGATLLPGGALGPTLGLVVGLLVGALGVWPASRGPAAHLSPGVSQGTDRSRTTALLIDALVYANLGLLDAALSHLFVVGGFARLNYAYLFVNAAIMVPSAAATVVALRISAGDPLRAHLRLRGWAVLAGLAAATAVASLGALFLWPPVAAAVDRLVGWEVASETGLLIAISAPFAGLRLLNTVGRQAQIARDPRALLPWDLGGLAGRALILGIGAGVIGVVASPLALAFAEAVQVAAWWRGPRAPVEPVEPAHLAQPDSATA